MLFVPSSHHYTTSSSVDTAVNCPLPVRRFRSYEVDPLTCTTCGALMKVMAFITDYPLIDKIIYRLGITFICQRPPPAAQQIVHFETPPHLDGDAEYGPDNGEDYADSEQDYYRADQSRMIQTRRYGRDHDYRYHSHAYERRPETLLCHCLAPCDINPPLRYRIPASTP